MADYDLKGFQQGSISQLALQAGSFTIPKDPLLFHRQAREICDHFFTLASASLLCDFKIESFFLNLSRCAANWRNFLHCYYQLNTTHAPLRYISPFYAAIITHNKTTIAEMLNAITREPIQGEEYPHHMYQTRLFLYLALLQEQNDKQSLRWLNKLEQAGGSDIAIAMFTALLEPEKVSQAEFWEAFEAAYYEYEAFLATKIKSINTRISQFIGHRHIWYEGLCWLHLAKQKGFTLPSNNIHYCPDEALLPQPTPYNNDWQVIRRDITLHEVEPT